VNQGSQISDQTKKGTESLPCRAWGHARYVLGAPRAQHGNSECCSAGRGGTPGTEETVRARYERRDGKRSGHVRCPPPPLFYFLSLSQQPSVCQPTTQRGSRCYPARVTAQPSEGASPLASWGAVNGCWPLTGPWDL